MLLLFSCPPLSYLFSFSHLSNFTIALFHLRQSHSHSLSLSLSLSHSLSDTPMHTLALTRISTPMHIHTVYQSSINSSIVLFLSSYTIKDIRMSLALLLKYSSFQSTVKDAKRMNDVNQVVTSNVVKPFKYSKQNYKIIKFKVE